MDGEPRKQMLAYFNRSTGLVASLMILALIAIAAWAVVKDPELPLDKKYEYVKQARILAEIDAALQRSFTPQQRQWIEQGEQQRKTVEQSKSALRSVCGNSYELNFRGDGEPYCKAKEKPKK